MKKDFMSINIPKLSVYTTEQGIKTINQNLGSLKNWRELIELIPKLKTNMELVIRKLFIDMPINKIMTKTPITIEPNQNIKNAIKIMNDNKITALFVLNKKSKSPLGIIHIHDCIKSK